MAEINVSMVLDAITVALDKISPNANIYIDKVEQGLEDGDILVRLINIEYMRRSTRDFQRVVPVFDIIYFPKAGNKDCMAMGDTLSNRLAVIELSTKDIVRAITKSFEIIDGLLHFKVSYPYDTIKYQAEEDMAKVILNRGN
nr:MAG TPA: tail completion protein [Caudoviricetes sp.]